MFRFSLYWSSYFLLFFLSFLCLFCVALCVVVSSSLWKFYHRSQRFFKNYFQDIHFFIHLISFLSFGWICYYLRIRKFCSVAFYSCLKRLTLLCLVYLLSSSLLFFHYLYSSLLFFISPLLSSPFSFSSLLPFPLLYSSLLFPLSNSLITTSLLPHSYIREYRY